MVQMIGAVNTITVLPNGKLRGDNTDWIGMSKQLQPLLEANNNNSGSAPVALLCGAGAAARAACFALRQLGFGRVLVFNRTLSRAVALARRFNDPEHTPRATSVTQFEVIESLEEVVCPVLCARCISLYALIGFSLYT